MCIRDSQYTRYGTVLLCVFQAGMITRYLETLSASGGQHVVPNAGWATRLMIIISITAGTIFIMWLGEQITENGIGNGISLIITAGIISRLPNAVFEVYELARTGTIRLPAVVGMAVIAALVVAAVVLVTEGQRRIPIQRPKQIRGRKIYSAQSTYIPLRVNQAGVIPIIFASSILLFPATVGSFTPWEWLREAMNALRPGGMLYTLLEVILIVFFCYFYTAITVNPNQLADDMKRNGGFIPGVKPGKHTAGHIDDLLSRITLPGAIFLGLVAILPAFAVMAGVKQGFAQFFGGTSLLIMVGVDLDTMAQIEGHLKMRHHEGLVKRGKIRSRNL